MAFPIVNLATAFTVPVTTTVSDPIDVSKYDRAVIVASGADIFIDADSNIPDSDSAIVPAGQSIVFSLNFLETLHTKAVSGSGYLTIYPI